MAAYDAMSDAHWGAGGSRPADATFNPFIGLGHRLADGPVDPIVGGVGDRLADAPRHDVNASAGPRDLDAGVPPQEADEQDLASSQHIITNTTESSPLVTIATAITITNGYQRVTSPVAHRHRRYHP